VVLLCFVVQANTPGINDVVIAAHCHDDLGCSTSNSLAAAMAGAAISALRVLTHGCLKLLDVCGQVLRLP
jgi:hypothetical protein